MKFWNWGIGAQRALFLQEKEEKLPLAKDTAGYSFATSVPADPETVNGHRVKKLLASNKFTRLSVKSKRLLCTAPFFVIHWR